MKNVGKTRAFVLTNWNLEANYEEIMEAQGIRFLAYGEEECPTTKRKHHQAFLYFHKSRTTGGRALKKIAGMFGQVAGHVEPMRGSFASNENYCSKEGHYTKLGDAPKQGARGDLDEAKESLLDGSLTVDEILVENPQMYHQYGRTLEKIETVALRKKWRQWMTKGTWIKGASGAGKSHMAFEGFSPETHYIKNLNEEWWDGYTGQETVILNEFRGQVRFSELLDLADKWPKMVKWRGRESVPFLAREVIITSVFSPREVYTSMDQDEPWEQFDRRFNIVCLEQKWSEGNTNL